MYTVSTYLRVSISDRTLSHCGFLIKFVVLISNLLNLLLGTEKMLNSKKGLSKIIIWFSILDDKRTNKENSIPLRKYHILYWLFIFLHFLVLSHKLWCGRPYNKSCGHFYLSHILWLTSNKCCGQPLTTSVVKL